LTGGGNPYAGGFLVADLAMPGNQHKAGL
jgi:hypothetical protein